jgi:hypothetical protein
MKWKLGSAFATGAVLASVIVYFAVRPVANVEEPRPVEPPKQIAATPVPVERPAPAPAPPVKHNRPSVPIPVREKPSPFRRPTPPVPVAAPEQPKQIPLQNVSLPAPTPASKPAPRIAPSVTLAAGTLLPIRIGELLSSVRNQPGDTFFATLTQPLVVDGWVIAERGARVHGKIIDRDAAHLRISVTDLATSDGQSVGIHTEPYIKLAPAEIPVEARIIFKVLDPVTITERLD